LLAEVRDGSIPSDNSDEQLLSIRASLVKSESPSAFVSSRASSRCFRFVDRTFDLPPIDGFLLGSSEFFFPGEQPPLFPFPLSWFSLCRAHIHLHSHLHTAILLPSCSPHPGAPFSPSRRGLCSLPGRHASPGRSPCYASVQATPAPLLLKSSPTSGTANNVLEQKPTDLPPTCALPCLAPTIVVTMACWPGVPPAWPPTHDG
jgi:hypothetical protein